MSPQAFSVAPPTQLVSAGFLGAANLGAVAYLGALLRSARASGAVAPLLTTLSQIYPPLLLYAIGFVTVPAVREWRRRKRNRRVAARNAVRNAWAAALAAPPSAALRRKLRALRGEAREMQNLDEADAAFVSGAVGDDDVPSMTEDSAAFDEFDRRLGGAARRDPLPRADDAGAEPS